MTYFVDGLIYFVNAFWMPVVYPGLYEFEITILFPFVNLELI